MTLGGFRAGWIGKGALALVCLACISLTGCALRAPMPQAGDAQELLVIYQDWHTALILPASSVARYSRHLAPYAQGRYALSFGWGEANYFTGREHNGWAATKALLRANDSALQLLDYRQDPRPLLPPARRASLRIDSQQARRLVAFIDQTLQLDAQGRPIPLAAYGDKQLDSGFFFAARGDYHMMHNCNSWTAQALTQAGFPITNPLVLTPKAVFKRAQAYERAQQAQARP